MTTETTQYETYQRMRTRVRLDVAERFGALVEAGDFDPPDGYEIAWEAADAATPLRYSEITHQYGAARTHGPDVLEEFKDLGGLESCDDLYDVEQRVVFLTLRTEAARTTEMILKFDVFELLEDLESEIKNFEEAAYDFAKSPEGDFAHLVEIYGDVEVRFEHGQDLVSAVREILAEMREIEDIEDILEFVDAVESCVDELESQARVAYDMIEAGGVA